MEFPKYLKIVVKSVSVSIKVNESTTVVKKIVDKIDFQLVNILAKAIGFSYKFLSPKDGELGRRLSNGTWTGMVGMLVRGKADLIVSTFSASEDRSKVVNFGYPFHSVRITFATLSPEYTPEPTAFMYPFTNQIWISLIACMFIFAYTLKAIIKNKYDFPKIFLVTYGTFLRQIFNLRIESPVAHFLVGSWLVGSGLLSYSYAALLLSFLSFPPLRGVRTINELSNAVRKGEYSCYSYPGSFIAMSLAESTDPIVQRIGHTTLQNEGTDDTEAVLNNYTNIKKSAFIGGMKGFLPLKNRYFISEDTFFHTLFAIGMRKNFCCKKKLDYVMSHVISGGLYLKLLSDEAFMKALLKRKLHSSESTSNYERKLTIADMTGVFFLLIVGHIFAIFVFASEMISKLLHRRTLYKRE